MTKEKTVPSSVTVQGQQCPVSMDKKGNISTELKDPQAPIKQSPFAELMPASDEWVKKYGGSDVSINAYNIAELLKERPNDGNKNKNPGSKDQGGDNPEGEGNNEG